MNDREATRKKSNPLSLLLYIFAGLAFLLGVVLLIGLIGSAQAVPGYEMFFQLAGIEELAGVVLRPLQAALTNLGILLFVLMLAIAALLFTAGRLVARQVSLAERVRALEEKIAGLGGQS
jgi:hypothetical protein